MPFGNITANTVVYEPRNPGTYQKSGLGFQDPTNEFRIRPSLSVGKDGYRRAAVSKVLEKDVTSPSGADVRVMMMVTANITSKDDFTAAEIDAALSDLNVFLDAPNLNRILTGEA